MSRPVYLCEQHRKQRIMIEVRILMNKLQMIDVMMLAKRWTAKTKVTGAPDEDEAVLEERRGNSTERSEFLLEPDQNYQYYQNYQNIKIIKTIPMIEDFEGCWCRMWQALPVAVSPVKGHRLNIIWFWSQLQVNFNFKVYHFWGLPNLTIGRSFTSEGTEVESNFIGTIWPPRI